jgi:hypothetical protein
MKNRISKQLHALFFAHGKIAFLSFSCDLYCKLQDVVERGLISILIRFHCFFTSPRSL